MTERIEVHLNKEQRVKAKVAVSNVNEGDIGEARESGTHEYHLIYWVRQKSTRYYKSSNLEIL